MTVLAAITGLLALLALAAPFGHAEFPAARIGGLLGLAAGVEMLHALRRSTPVARRQGTASAVVSMTMAVFLINAPMVAAHSLRLLIAGWFGVDMLRAAVGAWRAREAEARRQFALSAAGDLAALLLLVLARGWLLTWVVALAGALRIVGITWSIMTTRVYATADAGESVVEELGLADEPRAVAMAVDIESSEDARRPIDREWTVAFVATLFAIHLGRTTSDATALDLLSPAVAVLGDMLVAVIVTLLVVQPLYLFWRRPTRWLERRAWRWYVQRCEAAPRHAVTRLTGGWLHWRLRFAMRMRACRYSVPSALGRGLQAGLPVAAVLAATVPVWGMSWYFDTENWAAGIWNGWAEQRTDAWREAMVTTVAGSPARVSDPGLFAVNPAGVDAGDFSFIVIGDTGEGDASQHVLRDQLLTAAAAPDARFVVVSSDVVYPVGAMKDYEAKFWLPFKGVTRPVYAIPGNHDWYDALDAFNATFLTADAARASMRARADADLRLTSTTGRRIDEVLAWSDRLRRFYRVPTGFQHAPFFEVQTPDFALLAIDTGILKTTDPAEDAWLRAALARSAGKLTMAVVGHPFYAGGEDLTVGFEDFAKLKQLLLDHGVAILMAGDTHDLEYYAEPVSGNGALPPQYFVNGGGGAYLSFGTALAFPATPPLPLWAHYPDRQAVTDKIRLLTPWWKRPLWWWTKYADAWPFTAEWLSAAFDYNVEPFFQSFIEVRVERSAGRVRLLPWGVHGRLTWGEIAHGAGVAAGAADTDPAEWVVPLSPAAVAR